MQHASTTCENGRIANRLLRAGHDHGQGDGRGNGKAAATAITMRDAGIVGNADIGNSVGNAGIVGIVGSNVGIVVSIVGIVDIVVGIVGNRLESLRMYSLWMSGIAAICLPIWTYTSLWETSAYRTADFGSRPPHSGRLQSRAADFGSGNAHAS